MIGGVVTKVIPTGDTIRLECEELNSTSRCGVHVLKSNSAGNVRPGDQIWWQGGRVFWTAYASKKEVTLTKVGYSFALK